MESFKLICSGMVAVLAMHASVHAQARPSRELSAGELSALASGKLVTRPMRQERGEHLLFGGLSWQVVDADPAIVWRALHDIESYPQMLPVVKDARAVVSSPTDGVVYIEHSLWPVSASYCVRVHSEPSSLEMSIALDETRPHSIDEGRGFLHVLPYAPHRTLIVFGMLVDIGHGLLAGLARSAIQRGMLEIPSTIKRYLESGGELRYEDATSLER